MSNGHKDRPKELFFKAIAGYEKGYEESVTRYFMGSIYNLNCCRGVR